MTKVLLTGGAGFIGSHTCLALLESGHQVVVMDDFSNGSAEALSRVAALAGLGPWRQTSAERWTGAEPEGSRLTLFRGDVRSPQDLDRAFGAADVGGGIGAVLHFAGLKAVGESMAQPLRYWDVNVTGTVRLLEAMGRHGCQTLVFSSSATLYGTTETVPIPESAPLQPINPYGYTKAAVERMLTDMAGSAPGWRIALLRYFNPVGAHPSGRIGEDPHGLPNNLFPFLCQVAGGRRRQLEVFGGDWPTGDGTGVRDYLHVMDLAEGHGRALDVLLAEPPQVLTLNLGSGCGHSVLELLQTFEATNGLRLPYTVVERRPGDSAVSIADPGQAERRMGWRTRRSLADICRDGWAWQSANPQGYRGTETQPTPELIGAQNGS
ncbi:UDP-glucose 4-epimerase GalE [Cyanobium gracile]|uniref:UDP-glucose 4-epimerase n=1 Tax=Cyanobium gracile UHCC 0281 TaxID=3110309 RepID=A0ABU5STU5_9CYAN|nr:UDP-glucose 4-epimerase GalE [Cyanobium gracile]MEA5441900.1 UDP-glucose 4-epimerase GalE [Cyanobium gracile UHCC 0281]